MFNAKTMFGHLKAELPVILYSKNTVPLPTENEQPGAKCHTLASGQNSYTSPIHKLCTLSLI